MKKNVIIAILLATTIFLGTTGCTTGKDRFYQQKIIMLQNQLKKTEEERPAKKEGEIVAKKNVKIMNSEAVAKKPQAKAIPIAEMVKEEKTTKGFTQKNKNAKKKKVLSWTDRIRRLEAKVVRHDRQIASNTRRLSRLERVMNRMGTALRKVIKKAGGIENIKEAIIGPFGYNSSKVTDEMAAQIAVFCKEYKKAANGSQIGKKLFINIEAFADKNGSPEYNQKLSQKRAKAVIPFFKKELAGIAFEISTKGAGETDEGFTDSNARVIKVTHEFKATPST